MTHVQVLHKMNLWLHLLVFVCRVDAEDLGARTWIFLDCLCVWLSVENRREEIAHNIDSDNLRPGALWWHAFIIGV